MLKDKIVIVTGAAGGIGKAIAIEAGRAGARLALVDVDAESLNESAATIRADGSEVLSLAVDITDRAVWQKSVDEIAEKLPTTIGDEEMPMFADLDRRMKEMAENKNAAEGEASAS